MSKEMTFLEHFAELRRRVMWSVVALALSFLITYATYDYYVEYLVDPLLSDGEELVVLGILDAFTAQIRFSFYLALVISSPIHLANIGGFVLPALTPKERRYTLWTLAAATVLAIIGALFAYSLVLPMMVSFMRGYAPDRVSTMLEFGTNADRVVQLIVAFAALFQFPLVLLWLMGLEVVQRRTLLRSSRLIIVLIFIISAIVTPPDPLSQVAMAIPLILLFYTSIVIAKVFKLGEAYDDSPSLP